MKKLTKLLALFMAVVMLVSVMPMQVLAYMVEKSNQVSIVSKDGKVITPDESWETAFPYGTFAFEHSDLTLTEGGETGVLRLYRLGGNAGRAIAYLTYVPTIATMADGSKAFANAAGSKDVVISVEDPLPIAKYQPLGKLPEPLAAEKPATILQSDYTGADAQPGDLNLTLDTKSESYQWQTRSTGPWEPVEGAVNDSFVVGAEEFAKYDFRCIYTVGGQQYGSASAKGEAYVREEEVLPVQPDGIELNPKATYSTMETNPNDPYLGYAFEVVFAAGEWVKEIHFSSPEDTKAEAEKFGMVTIIDCQGGSLYDSANTLALRVQDNEAPEPCDLGFAVTAVEADKASGDAIVTVRRTGGNQAMLTIDYSTKDGTALAGEDYMATSGTLTFYADADEQQIKIPMINDGIASEERRDFSVVLSDLKGDKDNLCTLTETTATVSLWNSAKEGAENLATLLVDGGAEDVSGAVVEGTSSVAPTDAEPVTGTQVVENSEPLTGVIGNAEKGDAGLLTYDYAAPIRFGREGMYPDRDDDKYWRDYYCFARAGQDYSTGYDMNSVGPMPFFDWEAGVAQYPGGSGRSAQFFSVNKDVKTLGVSDKLFAEHYDSLETFNEYSAEWLNHMLFGYEFTYGGTALMGSRGMGFPYCLVSEDCGAHMEPDGALSNKLVFNQHGFLRASWEMRDVIDSIILETKWFDANPSSEPAKAALRSGILHRRSLTNDLHLRILTANDADTCGEAAQLGEDFYKAIMPTV
ncbi:MAG: Calx-beta domain-containing protein, partial [Oscillospiraceae bacterium]